MLLEMMMLLWGMGPVAKPVELELRWATAPGCPHATVLRDQLDDLLAVSAPGRSSASASGRLEAEGDGYVLHLEVSASGGHEDRRLRAKDCSVLTTAGALVIAVTVDALATETAVEQQRRSLAEPAVPDGPVVPAEPAAPAGDTRLIPGAGVPPAPIPARAEPVEPSSSTESLEPPRRTSPRTPRWKRGGTLGASGAVAMGLTPGITGGFEVGIGWRIGPVRWVAAGYHWLSRSTELRSEVGVRSALSGASIRSCLAFERARLEVPLCLGLDLAAMHGAGDGTSVRAQPVRDLWVGSSAGSGLVGWLTDRFALQARVDLVLGLRRPAMFLNIGGTPTEAFRMSPVAARLLVGPVVRLW